jgi:plasmid stabilization system protein ParE
MTFRVRIRARARDDIRDARDWYEQQSIGLGEEFGQELERVFARLATDPQLYQVIYKHIHRALTRRFPYAVYFVIDDDRVNVLRIFHQTRNPGTIAR